MFSALSDFRRTWPQLFVTELLSRVLVLLVLTPLFGLLLKLFLLRTDDHVLTDTDIAVFVLHPTGLAALVIGGAVVLGISFARAGLLMVIGFGAAEDRRVTYLDAMRYVLRRSGGFERLAANIIVRVLLLSAPFLAAAAGLYWLLLRTYDINYYLTEKPLEFQAAVALAGLLFAVLAFLLLRLAAAWILALPIFLFEDARGAQALHASARATAAHRWRIALLIVAWLVAISLFSALVSFLIGRVGGLLIPSLGRNVALVAIGLGATLLLAGLANLTVLVVTDSLLSLLIVRGYRHLTGPGELKPPISEPGTLGHRALLQIPGKTILGVAVAALLVVEAGAYLAARSIDPTEFAEVIAHRGASKAAPENTMAAFERAHADGATWIELDVQENAEGEVIVAHDSDFMKQSGVSLKVWHATGAELRDLDIGSWFGPEFADQRVVSLRDVLEWARGKLGVVIELKYYGHDQELEARVVGVVEATGMESEVMLMSLKREGLHVAAELRPDWKRGLLNTASVGDLTRLDVDFLALNAAAATRAQIRQAHRRGMEVYVWTINDPLQMFIMLSRGVDGLITDEPEAAHEVMQLRAGLSPLGNLLVWVAAETGLFRPVDESSGAEDA